MLIRCQSVGFFSLMIVRGLASYLASGLLAVHTWL